MSGTRSWARTVSNGLTRATGPGEAKRRWTMGDRRRPISRAAR